MDLGEYLHPECIQTHVPVKGKWELLDFIAAMFAKGGVLQGQPVGEAEVRSALRAREEAQTTAIGGGIAIPHARISGFKGMAVGMVTHGQGLDFAAPDGMPVRIIWAILVAEEEPSLALQAYARIHEWMQDPAVRSYFASTVEPDPLREYITQRKITVQGTLQARDIMRPPFTHVLPDTPLREVVKEMRRHSLHVIPIESPERRILGEISCDRLFQFGIPDFFNQLQSVEFISRFDPFQKYFSEEGRVTARDVMQERVAVVKPDAAIMEVVFALAVLRHPAVHVAENGIRIGSIDRIEVLNRILDF